MTSCPKRVVLTPPEAPATAPRRALLLDRDGVINVNHGYVHTAERTDWVPGIFELCSAASARGYLLVVVTNQAGIGRGYYSEADFDAYTRWMAEQFRSRGIELAAVYYCPHHPEAGVGEYQQECPCRKPSPGMLLAASADYDIDLSQSLMIGDKCSDMQAGAQAGVAQLFLLDDEETCTLDNARKAVRLSHLDEARALILS